MLREAAAARARVLAAIVPHGQTRHPAFVALLRAHRIALCVADTAGRFPDFEDVTADVVYVRLHGDAKLYESGYSGEALALWARRIDAWRRGSEGAAAKHASGAAMRERKRGRDVYVYFDNDIKVRAPFDARTLLALLEGSSTDQSRAA